MGSVKITGVGMHSGNLSNLTVRKTDSGGIIFVKNGMRIPARFDNVTDTSLRNTTIGQGKNRVKTIEHLMAALFILGIQNAEIEIDNDEIPILDGSADELIQKLKIIKPAEKKHYLVIKNYVIARESEIKLPLWLRLIYMIKGRRRDGFVELSPAKGARLELTSEIDYPKIPVIGQQKIKFQFNYSNWEKSVKLFLELIAKSRTFGTESEWKWLKKRNMGRGADGRNVLAVNQTGDDTLNDMYNQSPELKQMILEKYGHLLPADASVVKRHFKDEFVRHKIIDAMGDLFASGYFIVGKYNSYKGGHALNNLALRKLFANPENYEIQNYYK